MNTNKRAVESFVVASTTMQSPAIRISTTLNDVNGNVQLADGQLGIVSDSMFGTVAMNSFTDATPTVAEAPVIRIYQGTSASANVAGASATYPLWVRPFERTMPIDGRGKVTVTRQAYRAPLHDTWVLGANGAATEVNVADDTLYSLQVALRGYRIQEMYSFQEAASITTSVTTPNFTDLSVNEASGRSWILHNTAYQINQNSTALKVGSRQPKKTPVLALLIASDGGAGTEIGGLTPIAAGDVVPVINTTGGVRNITLTEAMATSIKNAAIAVTGDAIADVTWTILTIDLADAYNVATAEADGIILIGLDETLSYVDFIPQVKTRLEVGLVRGFAYPTVHNARYVAADEGQGSGRVLDLLYKATQGQRKYSLRHVEDPVVNFPSPFDVNQQYVVYNILHGKTEHIDTTNTDYSPLREIVAIPRYSSGTTAHASIGLLDTALNGWLTSGGNPEILSVD